MARRSLQRVVNLARQRWAVSVIKWSVIEQPKLTILATVDGWFITLIIVPIRYHDHRARVHYCCVAVTGI